MSYPMRLTRDGESVLLQGIAGEEIHFTRVALGDGEFDYDTQNVYSLTDMVNFRMNIKIVDIKVPGDGTCVLHAYENNAEVYEGFAAREIAVFATDPKTGKEILYSYVNRGTEYDFLPSNTGSAVKNVNLAITTVVRDAANITAVIDSSFAYTSAQNFYEHINAEHPHPRIPNHFLDVTETDHIWATDADDHLHKISVANFKNALGIDSEIGHSVSDLDIIKAREQLGIDANVLLLEDFSNPELADTLKVRVTSSAKGGNLLGLSTAEGLITGQYYWLCDGVSQEQVKVVSVISNESGLHARIENRLDNQFDADNSYLLRTTAQIDNVATGAIDAKSFDWIPTETFKGLPANTPREIDLETRADKHMDFIISGDGVLTTDGYFTMA